MKVPDIFVGKRLFLGCGNPEALGRGPTEIRGSGYLQGPTITGIPAFPNIAGTAMIGPLANPESLPPFIPGAMCYGINNPYSLAVAGPSALMGNTDVAGNVTAMINVQAQGNVISNCGRHILALKKDLPFDMPHPNKEGWRLRHVCIEGPEIAVYCRGKVPPDGIIHLPTFWDGLVNPEDMSISLTPIGSWQELYVEKVMHGKQVIVKNNTGGNINADYYIVARRLDDDLIVEYEGESHEDYPGGNEGYSFNFEHNYVEGLIRDMVNEKVEQIEEEN
tara:strand:+ start:75 stop:905 length:831 start_codon:yes stop_codon:yes gene_type:complete